MAVVRRPNGIPIINASQLCAPVIANTVPIVITGPKFNPINNSPIPRLATSLNGVPV